MQDRNNRLRNAVVLGFVTFFVVFLLLQLFLVTPGHIVLTNSGPAFVNPVPNYGLDLIVAGTLALVVFSAMYFRKGSPERLELPS